MNTSSATSIGRCSIFVCIILNSNVNREEQKSLEDFFKAKSIRIKNEMAEEVCFPIPPGFWIMLIISGFGTYCCCA